MLRTIKCPVCATEKEIDVPDELFGGTRMGLIKVHVESQICCEHQFIAFFSKSGMNAGYENLDVSLDISAIKTESEDLYLRDLLKEYGDYNMTLMLHAMILNIPVIILHTKYEHVNKAVKLNILAASFLPEKYFVPMQFLSAYDLEYHKNPRTDALVIAADLFVVNTPWPEIAVTYEKELIKNTLSILDDQLQGIIMQEEMLKLFGRAEYFIDILNKWASIYEEDAKSELQKEFPDEIDEYMYSFLLQILERRYHTDLSKIKIPPQAPRRRLR